jgi:hypothetical protein
MHKKEEIGQFKILSFDLKSNKRISPGKIIFALFSITFD